MEKFYSMDLEIYELENKSGPFFLSARRLDEPCVRSSDRYPSATATGSDDGDPGFRDGDEDGEYMCADRLLILALFFIIVPSINLTPNSFTPALLPPRVGQVRELCPLLLQWEHLRVMAAPS